MLSGENNIEKRNDCDDYRNDNDEQNNNTNSTPSRSLSTISIHTLSTPTQTVPSALNLSMFYTTPVRA
jgi:hypothetical protein